MKHDRIHARQHSFVEQRIAAARSYDGGPLGQRERTKAALWTLTGHLSSCHGIKVHVIGDVKLDDLIAKHDALHGDES